jgi:ABC-type transport system involved in Fe-S cluster assembly fused permease/ATPase subunit
VKYFNGEEHENGRYQEAIRQYQTVEYRVLGAIYIHAYYYGLRC